MSRLLLLHSALGLRPAVIAFADGLRARGHEVDTPDFYDGHVFDDGDEAGIAYRDEVGGRALLGRLAPVLDDLPPDTALAGFSLGAAFAQHLATRRPQARAVALLHHASAPRGEWPGMPVQVHRYAQDPWIEPDDVVTLGERVRASGARFEDVVVPGSGHLFTDSGATDGDAAATAAALDRVDALLRGDGGAA